MLGIFYWWDPYFFIIVSPGILLAIYASVKVKTTFARASKMPAQRGWAGKDIAQAILSAEGINDVNIEPTQGHLSDHYDPRKKVLRLSPDVYNGRSLASAGVAAHEVGHAIQHARGYAPLALRNSIVPVASFGSSFSWILIMVGMAPMFRSMLLVGIALFQVEDREIGRVLSAAAMTYVAATITAVLTLLYYLWRSGLIGGRR